MQSNIYKIFDKLILNNLLPFIHKNNIIPPSQYSYKKSINCETQLIDLIFYITKAFSDKSVISVDIIFLDFSNAFNLVYHDILFKKLSNSGISNNFLKLIINMFHSRKEFVEINNVKSKEYVVWDVFPTR